MFASDRGQLLRIRLLALLGVVIISFAAIFVRLASVTPLTAAFFRNAYALPVLLLIAWRFGARGRPMRARRLGLAAGSLLMVDLVLWHGAIDRVGAGLGTVLVNTQVAFVGLAAWSLHGERPHPRTFVVLPLILLGGVMISGLGRDDSYGIDPVGGVLRGLAASVAYTLFLLLFRASNQGKPNPASALSEVTLGALAIALLALPFGAELDFVPSWPSHLWLLMLALGAHVVGWLLIATALPKVPAIETSLLLVLQPMLTMFWAAVGFGEWISPLQWSGVAVLLGGVAYLSLRGSTQKSKPGVAVSGAILKTGSQADSD